MKILWMALVVAACQAEPKPLVEPRESWMCNLDSDCIVDQSCDCKRCGARNKTVHVQMCGAPFCEGDACSGKQARCIKRRCEVVD